MNSLAKNSVSNVLYSMANLLFPLLTSMYVSRVLLAEGVGQVSYARTITSYFTTFAALGLPTYGIREIAKVRAHREQTDRVFSELLVISLCATAAASGVFLLMVFLHPAMAQERPLYLCCGIQLILNGINIDWFYRGREEYPYILCRGLAVKVLSLAAVVLFVRRAEDYILYALISSIAHGGNYVFNIIHARKFVSFRFRDLRIARHLPKVLVFALASLCTGLYSKLDITMLGIFADKTAVGLYTNAHDLAAAVTALCTAISTAFLPRLSCCYAHDREKVPALIETGIRVLCFFAVPMAVGVWFLAPAAVELVYGAEFLPAAAALRILSGLIVIQGFGNLLCYQLAIATGNEKRRLPAYGAAAVLNGVLNMALIPGLAQNGAAAASVAGELLLNAHQFVVMRKLVPYRFDLRALGQSLAGAAAMGLFLALVNTPELNTGLRCLLSVIGGSAVYVMVNLILKNRLLMDFVAKIREGRMADERKRGKKNRP